MRKTESGFLKLRSFLILSPIVAWRFLLFCIHELRIHAKKTRTISLILGIITFNDTPYLLPTSSTHLWVVECLTQNQDPHILYDIWNFYLFENIVYKNILIRETVIELLSPNFGWLDTQPFKGACYV